MRISDWSSDVCSSDLLAASFAAVLALMIGMQLWNEPAPTPVAPATVVADTGTDAAIDAVLDENPDLSLWLASNDAYALAMKQAMSALPIIAVILAHLITCNVMAASPPPPQDTTKTNQTTNTQT